MANTTLDLLIQARADFGNATSQIKSLHTLLQGLDQSTPGGLLALPKDALKNIETLHKALTKAGMAGKALKDIQFPEGKFRTAAAQVEQMRRNFEQIQRTDLGRLVRQMAQSAGQDINNPLGWNWNRMTHGMQAQDAIRLRNAFRAALYQAGAPHVPGGAGGPGGPGGGPGGGRDWGAMGGQMGAWLGNRIGGGLSTGLLRTGGMLSSLAVGGGVMGAMFAGYRENQQTLEGVDSIFKSIGGNVGGFQALKDQVTELGSALQITGSAASELAASFVRTSGANDMQALERAQAAGQFGRGLGMDPGASAQLFGRAGLIGVGNTRQTQRDFAALMGKTIADSGMFARSEQVMEGMVGQLERIASTQGRTASAGEMQSISAILGDLLKNPALRGGGAQSVMDVAQRLGNGSDLGMAMMAYEGITGGDLGKTIEIAYADAMTPIGQLRGLEGTGITDTRADYMVRNVRRLSQGTSLDEGQFAAMHFGVNPELYRQYAQTFDGKRLAHDDSGFRSWMGQMGLDPDQVNMGGIGTLADIYKNQGAAPGSTHINRLVALAEEYRTNGQLKDQPALLEALNAASDPQQLQAVMAKIVGTVGAPKTEADVARQAQADLTTALGTVGEAINQLIPPIKDGLTPAVKTAAEYLSKLLDYFGVGHDESMASQDQARLDAWVANGSLESDYSLNAEADPNNPGAFIPKLPGHLMEDYQGIMRRRAQQVPAPAGITPRQSEAASGAQAGQPAYTRWNVAPPQAGNSGVTGSAAAATSSGVAPVASGDGNYDLSSPEWREYLAGLDSQYSFAPGTMMSLAQQESSNRALGYHYPVGPDGKRRTRNGTVSTASGIFGILDSTGRDPGYGVTPLAGPAHEQPHARQAQFAAEYLAARTQASGSAFGGLAAYGEGAGYASQVAGRAAAASGGALAAPVAAEPAGAPAAPVASNEDARHKQWNNGKPLAWMPDPDDLAYSGLPDDVYEWQRANDPRNKSTKSTGKAAAGAPPSPVPVNGSSPGANDAWADMARGPNLHPFQQPTPPPTPDPVASMTTPTAANARVDGQVSVNINVAKDGKPVSESFRALSFGEPRVPGSGGTLPKNNRVEWSNTV